MKNLLSGKLGAGQRAATAAPLAGNYALALLAHHWLQLCATAGRAPDANVLVSVAGAGAGLLGRGVGGVSGLGMAFELRDNGDRPALCRNHALLALAALDDQQVATLCSTLGWSSSELESWIGSLPATEVKEQGHLVH